ncbi:MAG: antibiotic biosynthesis monooxygenase [Gammaproteobacteria bacterium]
MSNIIVVFRARPREVDDAYMATALRMRDKALAEYGCTEFVYATTPDGEEVALSYWPDEASILRWKRDLEHQAAQAQGRSLWYASYLVQVAELKRAYAYDQDAGRKVIET